MSDIEIEPASQMREATAKYDGTNDEMEIIRLLINNASTQGRYSEIARIRCESNKQQLIDKGYTLEPSEIHNLGADEGDVFYKVSW